MYRLADALLQLAQSLGVVIRTEAAVVRIIVEQNRARAVVLASGGQIRADVVVSNADVDYTYRSLLGLNERRFSSYEPSLSGFVLMIGVRQRFPSLLHHNIFFSANYESEFDALVERRTIPADPTVYVCNTSFTDAQHAPRDVRTFSCLPTRRRLKPHLRRNSASGRDGGVNTGRSSSKNSPVWISASRKTKSR